MLSRSTICSLSSTESSLKVSSLRRAGWRPIVVFALATVANLVIGLILAHLLWSGFEIPA